MAFPAIFIPQRHGGTKHHPKPIYEREADLRQYPCLKPQKVRLYQFKQAHDIKTTQRCQHACAMPIAKGLKESGDAIDFVFIITKIVCQDHTHLYPRAVD